MSKTDDGNPTDSGHTLNAPPPADVESRLDAPAFDKLIPESLLRTQILGISQSTLWRIQENIREEDGDRDQLPPFIMLGKLRYYHPAAVEEWRLRRQTNDLGYMKFVDLPTSRKMVVVSDHLSVLESILADGPARDRYNVLAELKSRDATKLDHVFSRVVQLLSEVQADSAISEVPLPAAAERLFWAAIEVDQL